MRVPYIISILVACSGHLATIESDIPVGPGQPWERPTLFEVLKVEVEDGQCDSCVREFTLTGSMFTGGRETFRINDRASRITASLYRRRARGEQATSFFRGEGVGSVTLSFHALFGVAAQKLGPKHTRIDCSSRPHSDEVCIPGGMAWTGDASLDLGGALELRGREERIIALSPFFLHAREVTVAEFRAGYPAKGAIKTHQEDAHCNFSEEPSERDGFAMNCLTGDAAEAYCAALGMTLPTEAQFEYTMGRGIANRFPWGNDEPTCHDAVYGGRLCGYTSPVRPGQAKRDVVQLPTGGAVFDLAGNVAEWTADSFVEFGADPCFAGPVQVDPVCRKPEPVGNEMRVVRGGDFETPASYMASALRRFTPVRSLDPSVGFRCVRSM